MDLYSDEREDLLAKLKAAASVDISVHVISTTRSSETYLEPADVITAYLEEAQGIANMLKRSVERQEEILKTILLANDNFIKARKSDPITLQRDNMVRIDVEIV